MGLALPANSLHGAQTGSHERRVRYYKELAISASLKGELSLDRVCVLPMGSCQLPTGYLTWRCHEMPRGRLVYLVVEQLCVRPVRLWPFVGCKALCGLDMARSSALCADARKK